MTSESVKNDPKISALDFVEQLSTLCGALLLNLQQGVEPSGEELSELQGVLQTLQTLADEGSLSALSIVLSLSIGLVEGIRAGVAPFDTGFLEILGELQALSEQSWMIHPEPMVPELESAAARIAEDIAQRLGQPSEPPPMTPSTTGAPIDMTTSPLEQVTAEENATFIKYIPRQDKIFSSIFPAGTHASAEALAASEAVDNISRVGENVVLRVASEGSLIVFAAELDLEMLEALVGGTLCELPKTEAACAGLPSPWNTLKFTLGATGLEAEARAFAEQVTATTPAAASPQSSPAAAAAPQPAAIATKPAASAAPEFEDFDKANAGTVFDLSALDPEMLQDFLSNADELLDKLSASILDLEANPSSHEAIEQIFRTAHTIKGTAGMFGFRAIERLTHVMENLFDKVRKGQLTATTSHIDAILFGFDKVRVMFDELRQNRSPELSINEPLNRLHASLRGEALPPREASPRQETRSAASASQPEPQASTPAESAQKENKAEGKSSTKSEQSGTIRVDLRRLDGLVNLVGELVIDRTRFIQIEEELRARSENSDLVHRLSESVLLFGRHMNEVQSIIMKIRMVPVGNAFVKFNRMVRDLSRECGKEIDLVIEGGEAELDKTLVEEIGDPLIHLLRNSVDHGIELPQDRIAAGKKPRGTIHIRAYQDSNMIVIAVQDDGRGLQLERIKKKAIQNGLIKETDILSNKEIFSLIFEAGFSTAEKVTNISGRGVGMDVVKKAIVKLKGVIDIDSTPGHGTITTIKLPLTLAIIPSLMVECFGESYAIPLVNVIESIRTTPDEVQRIGSADFVRLRERALPLLQMADVFDLNSRQDRLWYSAEGAMVRQGKRTVNPLEPEQTPALVHREPIHERRKKPRIIFVVVGVGDKRIGLVVNQLLGQQEIVIKSLGRIMGKPSGIAGGCVLGNGRVALVLDVGEIVDNVSRGRSGGASHVH